MDTGNLSLSKTMRDRATKRAKRFVRVWLLSSGDEKHVREVLIKFAKEEVRLASKEDKALIKELSEELEIRLRERMDKDIVDESLAILRGSARQDTKY